MKFELPRGMRDIDNDEKTLINYVIEKFKETVELFNFKSIDPSPLELLSTMEAKSGPAILNEVYGFTDKGGREIALRYDLTIGLTRYATSKRDLKIPIKLSSIGGVWRYDEPQAGRYRYFHQWDIEIYDSFNLESDSEMIEFISIFFNKLGLDILISINDRRVIEEYVSNLLGSKDTTIIDEVYRAIDKINKKGKSKVLDEYKHLIDQKLLEKILDTCTIKGSIDTILSSNELRNLESIEYLRKVDVSLKARNISNYEFNLAIVRGLDYYSGLVFEVTDPLNQSGSLVGGGRYDTLTEVFGRRDLGAVGAAGGIERILLSLKTRNKIVNKSKKQVYVAMIDETITNYSLNIISILRRNNIAVEYDILKRSLKKQLDEAIFKKSQLIIIIGQAEMREKQVKIKNPRIQKEELVDLNNLVDYVNKNLI